MKEKYAVDVSHSKDIHRVDQAAWDDAPELELTADEPEAAKFLDSGVQYEGHLLPKSGPRWEHYKAAALSPGKSRAAVYSYDGTITHMSEQDMSPFFWKWFGRMSGTYWTEIYDVPSARRLIQISGAFRGVDLTEVQGKSYWLGGRFYLMPLKPNGMRSFLLCDVDLAAKSSGAGETEAPALSDPHAWERFLSPRTPQANMTGLHDEAVLCDGTHNIEAVNVTVSLDVQVPGRY